MFDSLTENGKGVLKLIIKEQITQISKQKDGPNFKGIITAREKNLIFDIFKRKRGYKVINPINGFLLKSFLGFIV